MADNLILFSGKIALFSAQFAQALFRRAPRAAEVIRQLFFLVASTLPLISVIAFFIGVIIGFQTAYQLKLIASEIYIAPLVALSIAWPNVWP